MQKSKPEILNLLVGALGSLTALLAAIAALTGQLESLIGDFANSSTFVVWSVVVAVFGLSLYFVYQGLSTKSRLLRPECLRLDPDNPDHLKGREDDVAMLREAINHPIVILEGESGSGKSALIRSGLIPSLETEPLLIPLYINNYGRDWEKGPEDELVTQLWKQTSDHERESLGVSTMSDIRAALWSDTQSESLFGRIQNEFGKTPLLIFDQFDDYQTQHRERFLNRKRQWLSIKQLTENKSTRNVFWSGIRKAIEENSIRCMFVTRSDAMAGMSAVHFAEPRVCFLQRLEPAYVIALLEQLVTFDQEGQTPVVANPDSGWDKLKERLVKDLAYQRRVLPMQVSLCLKGLVKLPYLSISTYQRNGGAAGIESSYVQDSIVSAANRCGLDRGSVLQMLMVLIDDSTPDAVKTQACQHEELVASTGYTNEQVSNAMELLAQGNVGVIRKQVGVGEGTERCWALYHDYFARAVLAIRQQSEKWQRRLIERADEWNTSVGWIELWRSLLTPWELIRILFARFRGKVRLAGHSRYLSSCVLRFLPYIAIAIALTFGGMKVQHWAQTEPMKREHMESAATHQERGDPTSAVFSYWEALALTDESDPLHASLLRLIGSWDRQIGQPIPLGVETTSVNFSRDGRLTATASPDRVVRIWDNPTGRLLGETEAHESIVELVRFSSDGKYFVTVSDHSLVRVWDTSTQAVVGKQFEHEEGAINCVCLSPDARHVILGGHHFRRFTLWDTQSGTKQAFEVSHNNGPDSVEYSPDGKYVVTGSMFEIKMWDMLNEKLVWEEESPGGVVTFSTDGKLVVSGGGSSTSIRLWDVESGEEETVLPIRVDEEVRCGQVSRFVMTPDSSKIAVAGYTSSGDSFTLMWSREAQDFLGTPRLHGSGVSEIGFSYDGMFLMTADMEGRIRRWTSSLGEPAKELVLQTGSPPALSMSGRFIIVRNPDNVSVVDLSTGNSVGQPLQHDGYSQPLCCSADGKKLLAGNWQGGVILWDTEQGVQVRSQHGFESPVIAARFSGDGERVCAISEQGLGKVWDAQTGQPEGPPLKHEAEAVALATDRHGRTLLIAYRDNSAILWRSSNGSTAKTSFAHRGISVVALTRDGKIALTCGRDKNAQLWDAETETPIGRPLRHEARIVNATFNDSGDLVLTGCDDGTAWLWDVQTGILRGEVMRHSGQRHGKPELSAVAFSEDDGFAITAERHGRIRFWKVSAPLGLEDELIRPYVEWRTGFYRENSGSRVEISREQWLERFELFRDDK